MAEPMVELDRNGTAPVISYNVPERTSRTGRNYVVIDIPQEYFSMAVPGFSRTPINPAMVSLPARFQDLTDGGVTARAERPLVESQAIATDRGLVRIIDPNSPRAGELRTLPPNTVQLDPAEVEIMRGRGLELNLQRAGNGDLLAGYVPAPRSATRAFRMGDPELDPEEPSPVPIMELSIESPQEGALLTGSAGNVGLIVRGTVIPERITVDRIEGRVLGQPVQNANLTRAGGTIRWDFQVTFANDGPATIEVVAYGTAGVLGGRRTSARVGIVVASEPRAPEPDITPPSIAILAPDDGGLVRGSTVELSGTAEDSESGVNSVVVWLDGGAGVPATPAGENDWSRWSARFENVSPGRHRVGASAMDNAFNGCDTYRQFSTTTGVRPTPRLTRLMLIEVYQLISLLGNYGAARVLKTTTLFPGERVRISVKSFTKTSEERKASSNILDSAEVSAENSWGTAIEDEQTNKEGFQEAFNYKVGAQASGNWGWGTAQLNAELAGSSNSAREGFARNMQKATNNHVSRSSSKRNIEVNTEFQVRVEASVETSMEREFQNINVSRTLNFVFRQMNQEFYVFLNLVDVRIGFYQEFEPGDDPPYTWREVTVGQLDDLLTEVVAETRKRIVRESILKQLSAYAGANGVVDLVEIVSEQDSDGNDIPGSERLRLRIPQTTPYQDPLTGFEASVPGVILSIDRQVLPTEGVIVEAVLGEGEALDSYSRGLQEQQVLARRLENEKLRAETERMELAMRIVEQRDTRQARLFQQVFACCPKQVIAAMPLHLAEKPSRQSGTGQRSNDGDADGES
jgi:hypothetical protein